MIRVGGRSSSRSRLSIRDYKRIRGSAYRLQDSEIKNFRNYVYINMEGSMESLQLKTETLK